MRRICGLAVVALLAAVAGAAPSPSWAEWVLDLAWPAELPAEADYFSAIAVDSSGLVHVSVRAGLPEPILVFDDAGSLVGMWGADHVYFDNVTKSWGAHGMASQSSGDSTMNQNRLWVADILEHTAKAFDADHDYALIASAGTPGKEGHDVDVLQFGSTADVATGVAGGALDGAVWVSDGDGGVNNRVVRLNMTNNESLKAHPDWVTGGTSDDTEVFSSPHSIAYHDPSRSLLVADRDNYRIDVLDAATGVKLTEWTECFGDADSPQETVAPWSIRMFHEPSTGNVKAVVAVADTPQDGGNQRIVVLDVTSPDALRKMSVDSPDTPLECNTVAQWSVDPALCRTPHEISVDPRSGDIFVACVTTDPGPSAILRYRRTG